MADKPTLKIVDTGEHVTPPPQPLGSHGGRLWARVLKEFNIDDSPGLEMLCQACLAADRAAELQAVIDRDGGVIMTKAGPKTHPSVKEELMLRSFVVRTLERLKLDRFPARVGRPGVPNAWSGQ